MHPSPRATALLLATLFVSGSAISCKSDATSRPLKPAARATSAPSEAVVHHEENALTNAVAPARPAPTTAGAPRVTTKPMAAEAATPAPANTAPVESAADLEARKSWSNPIVAGYAPDPSVCRVGDDFYLANSSFTMLPGLPIYHSKDLVSWKLVGHALQTNEQNTFLRSNTNGGIYAPTLRYHDGTFYLIVKNVAGGNELYRTSDPAGKWDGPTRVGPNWDADIDPDIFFDTDGKAYVCKRIGIGDGSKANQFAWHFDPKTATITSDKIPLWDGTGKLVWPEGGHLYHIGNYYYYMLGEGGTEDGHRETIARRPVGSGLDDTTQQWEPCPHNPILRNDPDTNPEIYSTGHADLVQDARGNWWMVFLGQRKTPKPDLGRETYLASVKWVDGWPVVNDGKPITLAMKSPIPLPGTGEITPPSADGRVTFTEAGLPLGWNFLRKIDPATFSLTEQPGKLVLHGTKNAITSRDVVAWVGRRLIDKEVRVSTTMTFAPGENQSAGINLFGKDDISCELSVRKSADGGREAVVIVHSARQPGAGGGPNAPASPGVASDPVELPSKELESGGFPPIKLEMMIRDEVATFRVSADNGANWKVVKEAPVRDVIGFPGFTGLYVAMHAVGEGATATFDGFEYQSLAGTPR